MCVEALELAIKKYGVPEIMHTDRGRQFMGRRFQGILEEAGVRISVGERGYKVPDDVYYGEMVEKTS